MRAERCKTNRIALFLDDVPKWTEFTTRYCDGHFDKRFGIWDVSGASNIEELQCLLSTKMVRRMAVDVLNNLPPKTRG